MAFDLTQVMEVAKTTVEGTKSSGNYPPIIYPGDGTISFRLLFNPKSNSVMRLIHRHKLDGGKVDCAAHYGQDCPVCKQLETIKTMKGMDLWTLSSKVYGIAYAQLIDVSTGYDFGNRRNVPKTGDLVVLMFPWSVYSQISGCIQKAAENADQLLTLNEAKPFMIERKRNGDRVEYRVDVNSFSTYKSCESQAQFEAFLNDLPDLNDTITPKELPVGLLGKLQLEADNLAVKYGLMNPVASNPSQYAVAPSISNNGNSAGSQENVVNNIEVNNTSENVNSNQNSEGNNDSNPSCFGNLNLSNRDCLVCPHTIECSKASKK